MHTTCTFMGKTKALVISLTEFKSAAAAAKKVTAEYLAKQDNGDDDGPPAKIEPEGGLGDKAFYRRSAHAAMVLMLKGTRTYGAVLGGGLPAGADPRASLRKIVVGVAAKVS